MISAFAALLLTLTQTPANDAIQINLILDGTVLSLGQNLYNTDNLEIPVPLEKAVAAISHGLLRCNVSKDSADISLEGADLVKFSFLPDRRSQAQLLDPDNPNASKSMQLRTPARIENGVAVADLISLCGILGVTLELEDNRALMFTPQYWAKQLRLDRPDDAAKETFKSVAWMPELGISPPAKTILIWARPDAGVQFGQLFYIDNKGPQALLGVDAAGGPVEVINNDLGTECARQMTKQSPLQAAFDFYGIAGNQPEGSFAMVATHDDARESMNGDNSARIAVNEGRVRHYAVLGLRQRVTYQPVDYDVINVTASEEKLDDIANKYGVDTALFRSINGLEEEPVVHGPCKLAVPLLKETKAQRDTKKPYDVGKLYEVQPGDKLGVLAKAWRVNENFLHDENASLLVNGNLEVGSWIRRLSPKPTKIQPDTRVATLPRDPIIAEQVEPILAQLKEDATIAPGTAPNCSPTYQVKKNHSLMVGGSLSISGKTYYRVQIRIDGKPIQGVVLASAVLLPAGRTIGGGSGGGGSDPRLVAIAEKYLGVRYHLGSANTRSGTIDCSNFVAQVFRERGLPVPPPPVHAQETDGYLVYVKAGRYETGYVARNVTEMGKFSDLQTGDRVIIQKDPDHMQTEGYHHTGIYIGKLEYGGVTYEHAVIHAGPPCVQITDMLNPRIWNNLRFVIRSK